MNKVLFFLLITASAYCSSILEVKGGYFNFSNSKLRKIYTGGGLDLQLAVSYEVDPIWNVYAAVEYAQRSGYSLGAHERTRIELYPISVGLKPVICLHPNFSFYGNVGPRYFFVNQMNYSQFVDKRVHQNGLGGFVGIGLLSNFFRCVTVDLFAEYSFRRLHFYPFKTFVQGHSIEVGGYTVGLGVGYSF